MTLTNMKYSALFFLQRDFELLSFLVIVLAVKNRKWKPGKKIFYLIEIAFWTVNVRKNKLSLTLNTSCFVRGEG